MVRARPKKAGTTRAKSRSAAKANPRIGSTLRSLFVELGEEKELDALTREKIARDRTMRMDPAGLPALLDAIRHLEACSAEWVKSVPVHEKTPTGASVWEGEVQVFDLVKHPKGIKRAYAWSHVTEGNRRGFHVVLHAPPVDGPVMAVKTAVLAEAKQAERTKN